MSSNVAQTSAREHCQNCGAFVPAPSRKIHADRYGWVRSCPECSEDGDLSQFGAESDREPEFDVPNFNREPGTERTELGAALDELCAGAREYEPRRTRHASLNGEAGNGERSEI